MIEAGVCSAGFSTTQLPAASAGASFHTAIRIGKFRYFAGCIRAQEGSLSEIDHDMVAYHFHEPLGVVAERLVEVVGDHVVVDLGERALLRPDAAGEVAEMVDGEAPPRPSGP
jgi:hypothetical protein